MRGATPNEWDCTEKLFPDENCQAVPGLKPRGCGLWMAWYATAWQISVV